MSTKRDHKAPIFDRHLFVEGLRRLRVPMLAVGIPALTLSVLVPLLFWLNLARGAWDPWYSILRVSHFLTAPILPVIMLTAPILLTCVFSFLFKRRDADFYHALPYTRPCLFISFTAAALAVLFLLEVISAGLSGLVWALCPHARLVAGDLVASVGMIWLGTLVTAGVAAVAVSLAGTANTTLYQFCNLALVPRLFLYIVGQCLNDVNIGTTIFWSSEAFPLKYLSFLWSTPYGILVEWMTHTNTRCATPECFEPWRILYNFVVALLLFGLACFLFCRRKSEVAGHSALPRRLQGLFRLLAALPFGLLAGWIFVLAGFDYGYVLILVVVCLLVYLLYELLTTKRGRNMLRALPWAGILVAICILPPLIGRIGNSAALRASRDVDNVCSIYAVNNQRVDIDDPALIELLHTASQRPQDSTNKMDSLEIRYAGGYSIRYCPVSLTPEEWDYLVEYIPATRPEKETVVVGETEMD